MTRLYITSFPRLSHVCFISSSSYGTWGTDQNSIFCPIQILNDLLELKGLMFITWQINPKLFHWPSFGINMDTIVYVMAKSQEQTCRVFHWLGNMNKIYMSYLFFFFFLLLSHFQHFIWNSIYSFVFTETTEDSKSTCSLLVKFKLQAIPSFQTHW